MSGPRRSRYERTSRHHPQPRQPAASGSTARVADPLDHRRRPQHDRRRAGGDRAHHRLKPPVVDRRDRAGRGSRRPRGSGGRGDSGARGCLRGRRHGAIEAVVFSGLLLQTTQALALAGYLLAMALPVGLVWLTIQVIRRYRLLGHRCCVTRPRRRRRDRAPGLCTPQHIATLASEVAPGFAANAEVLLLRGWPWPPGPPPGYSCSPAYSVPPGPAPPPGLVRHRIALTLMLAAAGPLPYGLIRATWLTPWPLMGPSGEALPAETRIWGLLLGGGALLGVVLTIGLIRPWGVRFPRWMPRLAGRPVPVAAAAVPAAWWPAWSVLPPRADVCG